MRFSASGVFCPGCISYVLSLSITLLPALRHAGVPEALKRIHLFCVVKEVIARMPQ